MLMMTLPVDEVGDSQVPREWSAVVNSGTCGWWEVFLVLQAMTPEGRGPNFRQKKAVSIIEKNVPLCLKMSIDSSAH